MKKLFAFTLMLVLVALYLTAFVACNDAQGDKGGELVSDKVSEEEWKRIGDDTYNSLEKCKIVTTCDICGENTDGKESSNSTVFITSDVRYMKETTGGSITEYYDLLYDNKRRYFVKESGSEWEEIYDLAQNGEDDPRAGKIESAMKAYSYFYAAINYDDVEFSDELKGYYFTEESDGRQTEILIKFKNGTVAGLSWSVSEKGMTTTWKSYIEYESGAWGIFVPDEIETLLQTD